jgi:hypothetical protein
LLAKEELDRNEITELIGPSVHAEKKARLKDAESTTASSDDAAAQDPQAVEDEPPETADSPDANASPAPSEDGQSTTG